VLLTYLIYCVHECFAVDITGDKNATMKYTEYEELIVLKYGVELQGWTYEKFVCPSFLSTSLPPLQALLDAINSGRCKFIKLTPVEVKRRRDERQKQINEGTIAIKQRKQRSDIGAKRPRKGKGKAPAVDAGDTDEDERPRKRRAVKSAEAIVSDEDRD
jgi:hypothetical protein